MATGDNVGSFSISVDGESTGEKWTGTFECKLRLSMRDNITKDVVRRQLLGVRPEDADPDAEQLARAAGELSVRITKSPPWWQGSNNGLDLEDSAVIVEVFNKAVKLEKEAREALQKKAEDATPELKKKLEEEKAG